MKSTGEACLDHSNRYFVTLSEANGSWHHPVNILHFVQNGKTCVSLSKANESWSLTVQILHSVQDDKTSVTLNEANGALCLDSKIRTLVHFVLICSE